MKQVNQQRNEPRPRWQVDYITRNGWTPCLEFSEADGAYVKDVFTSKFLAISIDLRVYICPRER